MQQKENLYSLIACGVMLIAALFPNWMEAFDNGIGLMRLGGMSTLMRVMTILLLATPVCVTLYDAQDRPQLASLKKFLSFDKRIAHLLPLACLLVFYLIFSSDKQVKTWHPHLSTGFTLYLVAALVVAALPFINQKKADADAPQE